MITTNDESGINKMPISIDFLNLFNQTNRKRWRIRLKSKRRIIQTIFIQVRYVFVSGSTGPTDRFVESYDVTITTHSLFFLSFFFKSRRELNKIMTSFNTFFFFVLLLKYFRYRFGYLTLCNLIFKWYDLTITNIIYTSLSRDF